jgi:GntR family transcriptional regulator
MLAVENIEFSQNPKDKSPLYGQLARFIGEAIKAGRYQPDQALPSERILAETLHVSRVTARSAIDQLVEQGKIVRRRGSGNYIAPRLEQPLAYLSSFSEELHKRGYTPTSQWLDRSVSVATIDEQLTLGLSVGTRVARLERLRLADDTVMAHEVCVIPVSILPDPSKVENSLYEHLRQTGQVPVRGVQHIRALNASTSLAQQLGVPDRQALLFITRVGYLASGLAIELTHSYCRCDYYDFVAELRREG